jgi:hypothetical protein
MDPYVQTLMTVSVPTLAVLIGILVNNSRLGDVNNRIADLRSYMESRFTEVDRRFGDLDYRFKDIDRRFDNVDRQLGDMKELWRSELHRVEEILDARLKHLEQN